MHASLATGMFGGLRCPNSGFGATASFARGSGAGGLAGACAEGYLGSLSALVQMLSCTCRITCMLDATASPTATTHMACARPWLLARPLRMTSGIYSCASEPAALASTLVQVHRLVPEC